MHNLGEKLYFSLRYMQFFPVFWSVNSKKTRIAKPYTTKAGLIQFNKEHVNVVKGAWYSLYKKLSKQFELIFLNYLSVLSPLNEVEREAARMDEFGPTNAQLYGDYYNYSIKKKSKSQ